jgi:ATP-dependent DNA ligase
MRELSYDRRRELLFELGLDDGSRWRTPRHFVTDCEEVIAATRKQGLEGGGQATRQSLPQRQRNGAWVKHKHRRPEAFVVSGWMPAERRRPDSLQLARVSAEGLLEPAGSVPFVLATEQAAAARRQLEARVLAPSRRRQRVLRLRPELRAGVARNRPAAGSAQARADLRPEVYVRLQRDRRRDRCL